MAKRKQTVKTELPEVTYAPPSCPRCKSTNREPFRDGPVNELRVAMEINGRPVNHQVWRNTGCKDCGQRYRVIEYSDDPPATPLPPAAPAEPPVGSNTGADADAGPNDDPNS